MSFAGLVVGISESWKLFGFPGVTAPPLHPPGPQCWLLCVGEEAFYFQPAQSLTISYFLSYKVVV